jgi:hypothetical protein
MLLSNGILRRAMEDGHIYLGLCLLPIAIHRLLVNLKLKGPSITPRPSSWQLTKQWKCIYTFWCWLCQYWAGFTWAPTELLSNYLSYLCPYCPALWSAGRICQGSSWSSWPISLAGHICLCLRGWVSPPPRERWYLAAHAGCFFKRKYTIRKDKYILLAVEAAIRKIYWAQDTFIVGQDL